MKSRQFTSRRTGYTPIRPLITQPPKQKAEIERKPLGEVMAEAGADSRRMMCMINMCFHLADVMEFFIMDAERELKKVDTEYSLEMKHSVERIKAHIRGLVETVDKRCSGEYSEKFGEVGDELVEVILKFFKLKE